MLQLIAAAASLALGTTLHPPEYYEEGSALAPLVGNWSRVKGPLTPHFREWLDRNGYGPDDFARPYFGHFGSYGGAANDSQQILHTPVIFFHGNEDGALAVPGNYTSGSSAQIEYFLSRGYSSAELYVTTWGDRDSTMAMWSDHSCATLARLRRFVIAVREYTNSETVNIIAHSMGVTMARKIVKGGVIHEYTGGSCTLGEPLTDIVSVFIGISGANYGMCTCHGDYEKWAPTCNRMNGLYPGEPCRGARLGQCNRPSANCTAQPYSRLLQEMNTDGIREGHRVVSFWALDDDIVVPSAMVWDTPTSFIPGSEFYMFNMMHMATKETTTAEQFELLRPYDTFRERKKNQESGPVAIPLILFLCIVLLRFCHVGRASVGRSYERIYDTIDL